VVPAEAAPAVQVAPPMDGIEALLSPRDFPVPDLIPPAILTRRQVGQAKRIMFLVLATVVAVQALLFGFGRMQLSIATTELQTAQQTLREAEAEKAKYAEVPAVYAAVDAARSELAQAMGNEVQVARLVSQLSVIMPADVSLTQVSMTIGQEETPATSTQSSTQAAAVEPLVGTVSFSGEARTFDDVSAWIETLRSVPDYQNVVLTDVSRDTTNGVFTFSNTAELTDQALSGRFVEATE